VVLLVLVAGCGGGSTETFKVVRATGYRFSAPASWSVARSGREVRVSTGVGLVSVTRFPLLRAYRPQLWLHVVPELDRAAGELAQQQDGRVGSSRTVTIAGRRARTYDIDYRREGEALVERIGFVLRGKTEYLLLCRYERGGDTDACDRLVATFALG
jgi:hypothetical protein